VVHDTRWASLYHVAEHWPDSLQPHTERSSRHGSEPSSVKADVHVRRYALLVVHARKEEEDDKKYHPFESYSIVTKAVQRGLFPCRTQGKGWTAECQKNKVFSAIHYRPFLAVDGAQSASSVASATASAIFSKSASAGSDGRESCSSWDKTNTVTQWHRYLHLTAELKVTILRSRVTYRMKKGYACCIRHQEGETTTQKLCANHPSRSWQVDVKSWLSISECWQVKIGILFVSHGSA